MKQIRNQKSLYNLEKVLAPYLEFWDEWIQSPQCFLRKEEKILIHYLRSDKNIRITACKLGLTESKTRKSLNYIILKLSCNLMRYHQWIENYIRKTKDNISTVPEINTFLYADLSHHTFSKSLYLKLCRTDYHNLKDILENYSRQELRKIRSIGPKTLNELQEYLAKNNCSHLLTDK